MLYARTAAYGPINARLWVNAPSGTYFHTASFHSFIGAVNCGFGGGSPYWGGQTVGGWHRDLRPPCSGYTSDWVSTSPNTSQIYWDIGCYPGLNGSNFCVHEEGDYRDYVAIGGLNLEVTDYTAPTVSLAGQALNYSVVAGQVGVDVSVADQGSGVHSAWVDVNGTRLTNLTTSCPGIPSGQSYATQVRPCGNLAQRVELNTAAAPFHEGQNTVRVCAADYATIPGTQANAPCVGRTLIVDNSCADSQGAQLGPANSLSADFETSGGGRTRKLTVHSTEGAKLAGEVRGAGGGPVAAASICLYEQIDAPAEIRQLVQVTKTRSDGGYQLFLPAGPSRGYDVVYRTNERTLEQRGLDLDSIVVPTLTVGPNTAAAQASGPRQHGRIRNGQAARFTGAIPGPYAGDRVVVLQALVGRGCGKRNQRRSATTAKHPKDCKPHKWRTFKTLRTDSVGRYSGIYRFTQTSGKVRYSFRALVPDQAGYPYRSGTSGVHRVVVRGHR